MTETNFKHTDLGLIPHDWEVKTLGEICDVRDGTHDSPKYVKSGYPLVTSKNLNNGIIDFENIQYISKDDYDKINERSKADVGDILYAMIGTIGNPVLITKEPDFAIKNVALFKDIKKVCQAYIRYFFDSNDTIKRIMEDASGSNQKFIPLGYFRKMPIILPPTLAEQERIAGALSSIDTLIGALTEQIEKKRHIKQGAMQQLLTGKKRLAGFTGEWEERRLDEIGFLTAGGTPSTMEPSYWGGDINWLQSGAVQNCIITPDAVIKTITKAGLQNSAAYLIKPDSVLIAITGATCANVGYLTFESAANQSVVSIEPNEENCAMFLFQKLLTERTNILSNKGGSAQSGVTLKALKQLTIVVPPTIAEQSAIATVLSRMDTEIAALEQKRDKYIAIKSGMMQNLLTGKIRLV